MGHRPEVEQPLLSILDHLRGNENGSEFAFLYGPRGNGKTVLLNWLERQLKNGKSIPCAFLYPGSLESDETLAEALNLFSGHRNLFMRALGKLKFSFSVGMAGVKVDTERRQSNKTLVIRGGPLLVLVDEAQTINPQRLTSLLNAVQDAGRHSRIAVVLAGTPDLEDVLRSAHVSYWSRGKQLGVGRLPASEAELVIAEPFRNACIELEDGVAADLAMTADCYPYFLQVYGAAAWEAMASTGSGILNETNAESAKAVGEITRRGYYRERRSEFVDAEVLPLAHAVANAFFESSIRMEDAQLESVVDKVELDGWSRPKKLRFLRSRGFVWRPASNVGWEPGIPSLMDYILEEAS